MFLSLCVIVSLGRKLVAQLIIIDVQSENRTFQILFNEVKTGMFKCINVIDELKRAIHIFVK